MTDPFQLLFIMLVAANPATGLRAALPGASRERIGAVATAALLAIALTIATGLLASPLLDGLDIAQETARIAAGLVVGISGGQAIALGGPFVRRGITGWQAGIYPLGIPLSFNPAVLVAVIAFSANPDAGEGKTIPLAAASVAITALIALLPARCSGFVDAAARITGALAIVIAAAMVVSGVRDV